MNNLIQNRLKRHNQLLFQPQDSIFEELVSEIEKSNHVALVMWALDLSKEALDVLESAFPSETIFKDAYLKVEAWSMGDIKMKEAKASILSVHHYTKTLHDQKMISLIHGFAQALSVVHTPRHAMGFPIYALTYQVHLNKDVVDMSQIEASITHYIQLLKHYQQHLPERKWADFIERKMQHAD